MAGLEPGVEGLRSDTPHPDSFSGSPPRSRLRNRPDRSELDLDSRPGRRYPRDLDRGPGRRLDGVRRRRLGGRVLGPAPAKVTFFVDGKRKAALKKAPFRFKGAKGVLATKKLKDGVHELMVQSTTGTEVASASVVVTVLNNVPCVISSMTPASGSTISGDVVWETQCSGPTPKSVSFYVDGKRKWSQKKAPFRYGGAKGELVTTKLADGSHDLRVETSTGKSTDSASALVTVENNGRRPRARRSRPSRARPWSGRR